MTLEFPFGHQLPDVDVVAVNLDDGSTRTLLTPKPSFFTRRGAPAEYYVQERPGHQVSTPKNRDNVGAYMESVKQSSI